MVSDVAARFPRLTDEILDKLPAGVVYVETDGAIRVANPEACRVLGLSYDQVRERYVGDWGGETLRADGSVCPVEDYPVSRCLATGEAQEPQVIGVKHADGDVSWALFSASPRIIDGQLGGAIVVFRDISGQWLMEEKLRAQERRHRDLINNFPHGIEECDLEGTITYNNPAHARMHGAAEGELVGQKIWAFETTPDRKEQLRDYLAFLVAEQPPPTPYFSQELTRDGRIIDVQVDWTYRRDSKGALVGFISIITDITARLAAQREVTMQRVSRMESVGVLAGGIAHDFNNILTAMVLNISVASRQVEPESRVFALLEEAVEAADRASRLTQQLLTFAKGGSPVMGPVGVDSLLEAAHFALRGSNVLCETSVADDLDHLWADASQLEQVVQNLAINAAQAMPDGGTIALAVSNLEVDRVSPLPLEPGPYLHLSLTDHGVGIEPEQLGRIFDPYFTTKDSGSGLGLAVAHSIVKSHAGHLAVRSTVGVGTTFDIYLPTSTQAPAPRTSAAPRIAAAGGARLLVMDDDVPIASALAKLLGAHGYEVDMVHDGEAAIERYLGEKDAGRPYAALIMDLTVRGGMGGRRALEVLLENDPDVRALVMSGYSDDPVLASPESFGFSGMLAKPFAPEDALEAIETVLGREPAQGQVTTVSG